MLFDKIASAFLRDSADTLAEEVAGEDCSVLPHALSALVGKQLLFKVAISSDNLNNRRLSYRVDIVVDDADMLSRFVRGRLETFHAETGLGSSSDDLQVTPPLVGTKRGSDMIIQTPGRSESLAGKKREWKSMTE